MKDLRREYTLSILESEHLLADPLEQFQEWFRQCLAHGATEPNAMVLSTVAEDGRPSSRVVLMKEIKEGGIIFFTNYHSRKGRELESNPNVSLLFFWEKMERQVRIEGKVTRISTEESDEYFYSRPFPAQLGAMISPQSEIIPDRDYLIHAMEKLQEKTARATRPAHWGGYKVIPDYFEFWQGRENRLHDRFAYSLYQGSDWMLSRLAP